MADYSLVIKPSARKELDALDDDLFRRIERKIILLAGNARPSGCRKLSGHKGIWRILIGDYRVLYTIDEFEKIIRISRIAHRGEVYE